jgi:hypothetical protein
LPVTCGRSVVFSRCWFLFSHFDRIINWSYIYCWGFFFWKHENTVPISENIIPWTPFMTLKLVINYVKGNSVCNLNCFLFVLQWIVIYWKRLKIKVLHVSVEIVLLLLINCGLHSYWMCLQRIFQIMSLTSLIKRGHHGCDCMVVGFTTTYAISAYHH